MCSEVRDRRHTKSLLRAKSNIGHSPTCTSGASFIYERRASHKANTRILDASQQSCGWSFAEVPIGIKWCDAAGASARSSSQSSLVWHSSLGALHLMLSSTGRERSKYLRQESRPRPYTSHASVTGRRLSCVLSGGRRASDMGTHNVVGE